MGYTKHHAIVVTALDEKYIKPAHEKAVEIFGSMCSEIVGSNTNGYVSFFIAPDGSKEGWRESADGDDRRELYKAWTRNHDGCLDTVGIYYGGDEPDLLGIENVPNCET